MFAVEANDVRKYGEGSQAVEALPPYVGKVPALSSTK